jgi:hypothetical protein
MLQQLQPLMGASVRDIAAEANDDNTSRGKRVRLCACFLRV